MQYPTYSEMDLLLEKSMADCAAWELRVQADEHEHRRKQNEVLPIADEDSSSDEDKIEDQLAQYQQVFAGSLAAKSEEDRAKDIQLQREYLELEYFRAKSDPISYSPELNEITIFETRAKLGLPKRVPKRKREIVNRCSECDQVAPAHLWNCEVDFIPCEGCLSPVGVHCPPSCKYYNIALEVLPIKPN